MNNGETSGREKTLHVVAGLVLAASIGLAVSGQLEIVDLAVGRDVVDRDLVDAGTEFEVGAKVWFWNRVRGGARGDRIRHVWLRDGKEMLSLELELGGPAWRTWSNKTLHPGSEGAWTVEVRGADDTVLARQEFRCR